MPNLRNSLNHELNSVIFFNPAKFISIFHNRSWKHFRYTFMLMTLIINFQVYRFQGNKKFIINTWLSEQLFHRNHRLPKKLATAQRIFFAASKKLIYVIICDNFPNKWDRSAGDSMWEWSHGQPDAKSKIQQTKEKRTRYRDHKFQLAGSRDPGTGDCDKNAQKTVTTCLRRIKIISRSKYITINPVCCGVAVVFPVETIEMPRVRLGIWYYNATSKIALIDVKNTKNAFILRFPFFQSWTKRRSERRETASTNTLEMSKKPAIRSRTFRSQIFDNVLDLDLACSDFFSHQRLPSRRLALGCSMKVKWGNW